MLDLQHVLHGQTCNLKTPGPKSPKDYSGGGSSSGSSGSGLIKLTEKHDKNHETVVVVVKLTEKHDKKLIVVAVVVGSPGEVVVVGVVVETSIDWI